MNVCVYVFIRFMLMCICFFISLHVRVSLCIRPSVHVCVCHAQMGLAHDGRGGGEVTHLRGHNDAVICMVACKPFSIVVTGSKDRTAIIWDTNR